MPRSTNKKSTPGAARKARHHKDSPAKRDQPNAKLTYASGTRKARGGDRQKRSKLSPEDKRFFQVLDEILAWAEATKHQPEEIKPIDDLDVAMANCDSLDDKKVDQEMPNTLAPDYWGYDGDGDAIMAEDDELHFD